jgi:alkylhydroperoxidase family enzyme
VPDRVRRLVREHLAHRAGFTPALGETAWLDEAVGDLPPEERPAGRLALLTATASYRVTDDLIAEVRAHGHDDAALIELTSWASLTAARRIGAALHDDLR